MDCMNRVMDVAYIFDRKVLHTGESVILACLLHAKGRSRRSADMADVQRIMRDPNRDSKLNRKKG
jgi:hypothetical protein